MNRARVRRIAGHLVTGGLLGGLAFMTARALGFPSVFHLYGFEAFWPFVAAGALLYATPLRALVWAAAGSLLALVMVGALTPALVRPARALIRADNPVGQVDAVVVLSSGLNDDARVSFTGVDRLLSGIAFARSQRSTSGDSTVPLVLTVVTRAGEGGLSSVADQQRILEVAGETAAVHWTPPVFSTRDEARAVAALGRAQRWERIAVVTSPLHTRRACATFERVGISVTCVPSEARDFAVHSLRSPRDRLRATQLLVYETAGTIYYRLRRWM
ncbi:MAG TPA: YdcF family protein [Gemmatimonadaceae bacterium]|nr:YdcF family protein [Gemmatimonadaceae bacterium]